MCKIRWNYDAFVPLCCLVDLWRFQKRLLPSGTNAPIHQFSKSQPEKWDLTSLHTCRRWDNCFLRLKGCWVGRSGHVRCFAPWDSLDFWRWLLTGSHGLLPSGHRKRRKTDELIGLRIGKALCVVYFVFWCEYIVSAHRILFSVLKPTVGFDSFVHFKNDLTNGFSQRESQTTLHRSSIYLRQL